MQYYVTACSNDAMQYAVLEALEKARDYPAQMCAEFKIRRDLICERLNAMPRVSCNIPTGAFYVFPDETIIAGNPKLDTVSFEEVSGVLRDLEIDVDVSGTGLTGQLIGNESDWTGVISYSISSNSTSEL